MDSSRPDILRLTQDPPDGLADHDSIEDRTSGNWYLIFLTTFRANNQFAGSIASTSLAPNPGTSSTDVRPISDFAFVDIPNPSQPASTKNRKLVHQYVCTEERQMFKSRNNDAREPTQANLAAGSNPFINISHPSQAKAPKTKKFVRQHVQRKLKGKQKEPTELMMGLPREFVLEDGQWKHAKRFNEDELNPEQPEHAEKPDNTWENIVSKYYAWNIERVVKSQRLGRHLFDCASAVYVSHESRA
jgi:hypothetical protein